MNDDDIATLLKQNASLQDQLQLFVRTEQRLYQVQNDLALQLRRVRQLDEFALAASRSKTRAELFAYAFTVVMDLWAAQGVIAIEDLAKPTARAAMLDGPMTEVDVPSEVRTTLREIAGTFAVLIPAGSCAPLAAWLDGATEGIDGARRGLATYQHADAIVPVGGGVLVIRTSRIGPREKLVVAEDGRFLDLLGRHLTTNLERVHLHSTLEARIRESMTSLSALGSLAAGVAHEINNPLTFILHNQTFLREVLDDLARGEPPTPADLAESLATLAANIKGLLRIRDIVADLTVYAEAAHENPMDLPEETRRATTRMRTLSLPEA